MEDDGSLHARRMEEAQTVFSIVETSPQIQILPKTLTLPVVRPNNVILDRFWRRVAEVTTRYHDSDKKWIGGHEVRQWNELNRTACEKCINSKNRRMCIIDEDHPSCRACRTTKIGCDRKPRFVFDMTKDEFFPSYTQFLAVFQNKEPGRLRRYSNGPKHRHRHQHGSGDVACNYVKWTILVPIYSDNWRKQGAILNNGNTNKKVK
ncbi:hypothetical protein C8R44DRAFT_740225 [Mycena epipterygia]|nr:hypothetical protein C8R44DRAFT_740225 [Mycena epipterygia]